MDRKRTALMGIGLTTMLAVSPRVSFAQTTTTYSGEAAALKASAPAGISLALADTGPLPSNGGNLSTSVANVNVAGVASAHTLSSSASASGTSSQSQSTVQDVNVLNGLVAATGVKSSASATCSGGQASVSGNAQLIGLTVAGTPILVSTPNLSISLPGGISVIVDQRTSSSGGNAGSTTVNALHVTGPGIDIVVASAQSGITC